MFMLDWFTIGEMWGKYLIVVDKTDAVFAAIIWGTMLLSLPWLGNLKQPIPNWNVNA